MNRDYSAAPCPVIDALTEALALSSHIRDPFDQTAEVVERLWDKGIIITRTRTNLLVGTMRACFYAVLGGLTYASIDAVTDGNALVIATGGIATLVACHVPFMLARQARKPVLVNHR